MKSANFVIVGGGIAGASLGYFLARAGESDIVLLEQENTLAYHSSGRSAAVTIEWDDDEVIRTLAHSSRSFLVSPPEGFSDVAIFEKAGELNVYAPEEMDKCRSHFAATQQAGIETRLLNSTEACELVPLLREEFVGGAVYFLNAGSLGIHELQSAYVRGLKKSRGTVLTNTQALGVETTNGRVTAVRTTEGIIQTPWVINASGPWADKFAMLCGVSPLGIVPLRRTVIIPRAPEWYKPAKTPLVVDMSNNFYFKPEGASILACPRDEDPVQPGDARPDIERVAEIADKLQRFTKFEFKSIANQWAGLRTFAPDKRPVVGEDPELRGFFWLAGQGGVGILTSPTLGSIAAAMLLGENTSVVNPRLLEPGRFCELQ